jgi:aspartyl-tRNA(Asn)/glutamyl-tRNA(Gln) amidotransferase subunit A
VSETALEVRDLVAARRLRATDVVERALVEIESVDASLGATNEIFRREALDRAADLDRRLARGEDCGPLAGVPYTLKSNIASRLGETTAGSAILAGYRSPFDAAIVERLDRAGAVLLAKTNLDEFGMGSSTENSAFHVTRNPWKITHVPGGSSGGAAALAAATSGILHFGSDTGGSIRQPASYCGVTGFKPSYGRVSRYGLVAFASSLDQIGPIARDALDCALALDTIAGSDARDATSSTAAVPNHLESARRSPGGLVIGVPREYFVDAIAPEIRKAVEQAIAKLASLGVEIREVSLPHTKHANPAYVLISAAEASSNLARYDGIRYGHRAEEAADLLDLYCKTRGEGFGAEVKRRILIGTFVLSSGHYDAYYRTALAVRNLIRRDFASVFEEVDAVVSPTSPVAAFPIGDRIQDPLLLYAVDILTVPANLASLPGISVPCGTTSSGLPIGLQIYGRPFEDDVVLRLARAYQAATEHHRQFPPVHASRRGGSSA